VFFGSSNHYKKRFAKINRVENFLQRNRPKIQNQFFSIFLLSRFWAFLGKGSSNTRQKNIEKTNSTPVLFLGRIWWPEATRLEDPLDISNGTWTPKSSGERDGILNLV
jgi:hypothetical protein